MNQFQPDFILAMGDDIKDESLFAAPPAHAYSIKVGFQLSQANYFVYNTAEVIAVLEEMVARVSSQGQAKCALSRTISSFITSTQPFAATVHLAFLSLPMYIPCPVSVSARTPANGSQALLLSKMYQGPSDQPRHETAKNFVLEVIISQLPHEYYKTSLNGLVLASCSNTMKPLGNIAGIAGMPALTGAALQSMQ
jgi:hypothetical protein